MALTYICSFKAKAKAFSINVFLDFFPHTQSHTQSVIASPSDKSPLSFHMHGHYLSTTILSFLDYPYSCITDPLDFSLIHHQSKFHAESSKGHTIASLFSLNINMASDAL